MRDIREKLKQLKYQHLKKLYDKNLSKTPTNCKHNKIIILPNGNKVNICTFDMDVSPHLDLCYKLDHSKDCNAFCPIHTKESLKDWFVDALKDPHIRATRFKDINIIYWLYPDLEHEDYPLNTNISIWEKISALWKLLF